MKRAETFVPALGHPWVARLYDPLLRLTLRERAFKGALVRQATLPSDRSLGRTWSGWTWTP